jgi:hypothetical protein
MPFAAGQTQSAPAPKDAIDVSGDWQASWQGRLGAEQCTLHVQTEGGKLTGTFKDLRGTSALAGTVDGRRISFDVRFPGARPFTIRFTGTADDSTIKGTSQAVGMGGSGAYLGHAGEVVQPEHPWTAKRPKL